LAVAVFGAVSGGGEQGEGEVVGGELMALVQGFPRFTDRAGFLPAAVELLGAQSC
jgi:hypothetical protein